MPVNDFANIDRLLLAAAHTDWLMCWVLTGYCTSVLQKRFGVRIPRQVGAEATIDLELISGFSTHRLVLCCVAS